MIIRSLLDLKAIAFSGLSLTEHMLLGNMITTVLDIGLGWEAHHTSFCLGTPLFSESSHMESSHN